MTQLVMELPEEGLMLFEGSAERAVETVRMAAAVKLYEMGRLSSGAAATLAGMTRTVFLTRLVDYGVCTFRFGEDEFSKEIRLA